MCCKMEHLDKLDAMMAAGCERVLLAPLYPQYSGATTATVVDKASDALKAIRWQPSLRTLPPYHDDPAYIDALAVDISRQLDALDFAPELLLLSFHGMPERTLAFALSASAVELPLVHGAQLLGRALQLSCRRRGDGLRARARGLNLS